MSKINLNKEFGIKTIGKLVKIGLKLSPVYQIRNPVMFVTYCGALILSGYYLYTYSYFTLGITLWLWATIIS